MKVSNELRENYFSRILENLSSGLVVISKTGHINQINDEALRLLGIEQLTHIRALAALQPILYARVKEMKPFQKEELVLQEEVPRAKRVLGLQMVEINLKGEDVKVLTIHDLSAGMERKEIDDWIRLIRILSHEIMNSLAPITSISTTLMEVWSEPRSSHDEGADKDPRIRQTLKGLNAIAEQSEGLTTFFESYRVLSRIPDPVRKEFPVYALFEKLETLVIHNDDNAGVQILFQCDDPGLSLEADEQMITQVMLNLVKNAVQASDGVESSVITVTAKQAGSRTILAVTDNGHGVPKEIADEIFMPFFSTRMKGTGVGLSYSRQVMVMNGGTIEFDSVPGRTEFRLLFN
jgi:nitrogen fixation/metabolism regulation signal transduction histidine kinase